MQAFKLSENQIWPKQEIWIYNHGRREGEHEGQFALGIQGLRGLITEDFNILTAGNALKCIQSQSKGRDRKQICARSFKVGASFCSFVPGPPETLGVKP